MRITFSAIVLAGGRGSRLGGVDKSTLRLGDRRLLDRALDAVAGATETVVVGPQPDPVPAATFVREDPPFGGPAAALLTGAAAAGEGPEMLVVLAVDMPWVSEATVTRLLVGRGAHDGSVLVDQDGRRQLAMTLDRQRLADITPRPPQWPGLPLWRLLSGLDLAEVHAVESEAQDVDTPSDLAALQSDRDG